MGAFNIVEAQAICPACRENGVFAVQFKYGDTWQHLYQIGDKLKWGGNDIGLAGCRKVVVEGIGGPCPNCGIDGIEFNVLLESDQIVKIEVVGLERVEPWPEGFVIVERV